MPEGTSWQDARVAAQAPGVGWDLATITSAEENAFVFSLIENRPELWIWPARYAVGPWIGGWQDTESPDYWEPGGAWKWVTEEPWGDTAWAPGEPNDSGGNAGRLNYQHYGSIAPTWNDVWNDYYYPGYGGIRGYLAEIPEPATLALLSLSLATLRRR